MWRSGTKIEVTQSEGSQPMVFGVTISDSAGSTKHRVTLAEETLAELAPAGTKPAAFVEAAFRFLLERETKSDILPSFDINVIKMYFPSFERDIAGYF